MHFTVDLHRNAAPQLLMPLLVRTLLVSVNLLLFWSYCLDAVTFFYLINTISSFREKRGDKRKLTSGREHINTYSWVLFDPNENIIPRMPFSIEERPLNPYLLKHVHKWLKTTWIGCPQSSLMTKKKTKMQLCKKFKIENVLTFILSI
jgi:hypothetical protein